MYVCVYCFYTYVYIIMYEYIDRLSGKCGVADKIYLQEEASCFCLLVYKPI